MTPRVFVHHLNDAEARPKMSRTSVTMTIIHKMKLPETNVKDAVPMAIAGAVAVRTWRRLASSARRPPTPGVAGRAVKTVPGRRLLAFCPALPVRGVVLSQDLCAELEPDELTAVFEHERAMSSRAIKGVVETTAVPLSLVIAIYADARSPAEIFEVAGNGPSFEAGGLVC